MYPQWHVNHVCMGTGLLAGCKVRMQSVCFKRASQWPRAPSSNGQEVLQTSRGHLARCPTGHVVQVRLGQMGAMLSTANAIPSALVMVADETCGAEEGEGAGFAERLRVFLSRCIDRCPHVEGPQRVPGR